MKKLIIAVCVILLFVVSMSYAHEEEPKEQTYTVTITVKYKAISLKDIAKKDEDIKKLFGDTVDVTIEFDKDCPLCSGYTWGSNSLILNN